MLLQPSHITSLRSYHIIIIIIIIVVTCLPSGPPEPQPQPQNNNIIIRDEADDIIYRGFTSVLVRLPAATAAMTTTITIIIILHDYNIIIASRCSSNNSCMISGISVEKIYNIYVDSLSSHRPCCCDNIIMLLLYITIRLLYCSNIVYVFFTIQLPL